MVKKIDSDKNEEEKKNIDNLEALKFGQYQCISLLGKGLNSSVYKAIKNGDNTKEYALKIFENFEQTEDQSQDDPKIQ